MPERPTPKIRTHPYKTLPSRHRVPMSRGRVPFAELCATSNFTFLHGASHPEEIVERAGDLDYRAVAVADQNTLAGIVRGHVTAREQGLQYVVGTRIELANPALPAIYLYPTDRASYGRLCRLLTLGKRRTTKGACHLELHDLEHHTAGVLAVLEPPAVLDQTLLEVVGGLRAWFDDDRLSLAVCPVHDGRGAERLAQLRDLSSWSMVPLMATNRPLYHVPRRRALQDVLTCIEAGCTLDSAGYRLLANGERHLKSPSTMGSLLSTIPSSLQRSVDVAERAAAFSLDELRYIYPREVCPPGESPISHLRGLVDAGAAQRFPDGVSDDVRRSIEHELGLIDELRYAPYFLTVHDLVNFARGRGILCQGRGAAANSAVCYCLGVTSVDPTRIDLLFERFVSRERNEPPDIDIDFEHERREEVIQYIYGKYGRERAALTAEVISYRSRSAVREVGKTLGLSLDTVDRLAKNMEWWHDRYIDPERFRDLGLQPEDPTMRRFAWLIGEILGFPRHLSQHVGGFVITEDPLCELVPVENAAMPDRTVIEWDKDDIDAMGMMKVDCLGLGMLTCVRKSMEMINLWENRTEAGTTAEPLELHTIPAEDPRVYDMMCKADTVGVFQIESRAQMSMLPRLRPRCFYDLVIEVAIVRPGPIQGDMVHPYLRRRNGEEPVTFPDQAVRKVLERTLGVPLFQEQAMSLAIVAAGFTPGEADGLRRAMAAWKRKGDAIAEFGRKLIHGMVSRGYEQSFAERCFKQIQGFSEYGFPESHAASFALIVYVSAWLKKHHPAAFAACLINSQPMGFYAPAQIVGDAEQHGVEVRGIDVGFSDWDCGLEGDREGCRAPSRCSQPSLRLGMRLVRGLRKEHGTAITRVVRDNSGFTTIEGLWRASGVPVAAMRSLARADAFNSMGLERQAALWHTRRLRDEALPLFDDVPTPPERERPVSLPPIPPLRQVMQDYAAAHLSLRAHPVSFIRPMLDDRGVVRAVTLRDVALMPHGTPAAVAGLTLVRQRPGTAKGILFMTLEDETGIANLIVRPPVYERCRAATRHGVVLLGRGRVERQGEVVHLLVNEVEALDDWFGGIVTRSRDFH